MEIMCHQTARTLPPACRQELGIVHPEALTFLNGQAEPPRPPHYELPPQASWHKVLGQPRSSSATKPVTLLPQKSQPLQLDLKQTLRVQWGSTQVWGQTWLVCLFLKLSDHSRSRKSLASVTGGRAPCMSQCWHCSQGHYPQQEELVGRGSKRAVVLLQMEFQGGVACGQSSTHSPRLSTSTLQAAGTAELNLRGQASRDTRRGSAVPAQGSC